MKIIKYQLMTEVNRGTEENPVVEQEFHDVVITCTADNLESNVEIAKAEAYKGEYTIEDDGMPEEITQADRIEAQVTYTAMMTDTLLEV